MARGEFPRPVPLSHRRLAGLKAIWQRGRSSVSPSATPGVRDVFCTHNEAAPDEPGRPQIPAAMVTTCISPLARPGKAGMRGADVGARHLVRPAAIGGDQGKQ